MKQPSLTVDIVIVHDDGTVMLIKRKNNPFKGLWALPGGFVEYGETVEQAAVREAREETGIFVDIKKLVGVYSSPDRDPRGHTVTICVLAKPTGGTVTPSTDAADASYFSLYEINSLKLAFDHKKILKDALKTL
ncbi:MAG: NUDIX hydrolase [Euryarchaeota archaeon]|nr:NUDIX hydrolase [Euryarchaeota archaeon]